MLQHDSKEFDNDLGARSDQNLALSALLSIVDALKAIIQNTNAHHCVISGGRIRGRV